MINYTIREILNDNLKDVNYCQLRGCYFSLLKKKKFDSGIPGEKLHYP